MSKKLTSQQLEKILDEVFHKVTPKYGDSLPDTRKKIPVSEDEIREFRRLRQLGWTYSKIAEQCGRGLSTVFNYIKAQKVD